MTQSANGPAPERDTGQPEGLGLSVGDAVSFSKTVGETDIYMFAGITGDFASNHVNEHAMREAGFGGRIAHGALLVGYMSTCSTKMAQLAADRGASGVPMSLGFDRIRFVKPVMLGQTVKLDYVISSIDAAKRRAHATITVVDEQDNTVAVADHILAWAR